MDESVLGKYGVHDRNSQAFPASKLFTSEYAIRSFLLLDTSLASIFYLDQSKFVQPIRLTKRKLL